MLLLLLYWSFLGIVFLNLGVGFQKILRIKIQEPVLTIIFGMFGATILTSIWAIGYRINFEFQLFLLAIQGLIVFKLRKELIAVYTDLGQQIKNLSTSLKVFFVLNLLLMLLYIQTSKGFVDNETYYVQTIKWLNEYGLVKGLANLHIFFGQTSGWHLLQSAFSFSFVSHQFNQLNGFCLLLGNIFALFRLEAYWRNKRQSQLWIGLLPVANIVLFTYCSVPSPGLALAIISLLLLDYFLKNFDFYHRNILLIVWLLAIFLVYIKVSILPIVLIPIVYTLRHFKNSVQNMVLPLAIGILALGLFVTKNYILTGFPMYPSTLFSSRFQADFALPPTVYDFWFNRPKCYDFFISSQEYAQSNAVEIFLKWLLFSADSLMHSLIVLQLLILPFFIKRYLNQPAYWWIYAVLVFELVYLGFTSPQFRFVIPLVLFFTLLLLSIFIKSKNTINKVFWSSWIFALLLCLFPFQMKEHQGQLVCTSRGFSVEKLIFPDENSKLKTDFQLQQLVNLRYFSPDTTVFIWANGDGKLPCVNQKQLQYLSEKLHYIPQQRSAQLQDGFYSQKTNQP